LVIIQANLQLSVRENIAQVLELSTRNTVVVNVVKRDSVAIDFVEIVFKDQFISRADMWRLKRHLRDTCVYVNKNLNFSCFRTTVKELVANGVQKYSGLITEHTKFIFRSRSARFVLFFQMSKEMWDYTEDGELYFEKAVNGFLPVLYKKWHAMEATHSVSLIFFSRTYFKDVELWYAPHKIAHSSHYLLHWTVFVIQSE
jgi:hypothetical protein